MSTRNGNRIIGFPRVRTNNPAYHQQQMADLDDQQGSCSNGLKINVNRAISPLKRHHSSKIWNSILELHWIKRSHFALWRSTTMLWPGQPFGFPSYPWLNNPAQGWAPGRSPGAKQSGHNLAPQEHVTPREKVCRAVLPKKWLGIGFPINSDWAWISYTWHRQKGTPEKFGARDGTRLYAVLGVGITTERWPLPRSTGKGVICCQILFRKDDAGILK